MARRFGGYSHPWQRELDGPDPEATYDGLLSGLLTPNTQVLEAGCGHGPDAARFASQVARWTGYDYSPELLELALNNAPAAQFALWDGKAALPPELAGPFNLIVSRRGPTSVIPHLPNLAAPDTRFLYVGPHWQVPQAEERLCSIGWVLLGEWRSRVRAWLPSWDDYLLMCEFHRLEASKERWEKEAGPRGLAYFEERQTLLAAAE